MYDKSFISITIIFSVLKHLLRMRDVKAATWQWNGSKDV